MLVSRDSGTPPDILKMCFSSLGSRLDVRIREYIFDVKWKMACFLCFVALICVQ